MALDPNLSVTDPDHALLASPTIAIIPAMPAPRMCCHSSTMAQAGQHCRSRPGRRRIDAQLCRSDATLAQWEAACAPVRYVNTSDAQRSRPARSVWWSTMASPTRAAAPSRWLWSPSTTHRCCRGQRPPADHRRWRGRRRHRVSQQLSGFHSDVDNRSGRRHRGIGVDDAHGSWQYTRDGGSSWNGFGGVSATAARLLVSTRIQRYASFRGWTGTVRSLAGCTFAPGIRPVAPSVACRHQRYRWQLGLQRCLLWQHITVLRPTMHWLASVTTTKMQPRARRSASPSLGQLLRYRRRFLTYSASTVWAAHCRIG